jgi:hypothetical protein
MLLSRPLFRILTGYLEKLSFCPNAALRVKILSSEYRLYGCGKIFTRALILNQNPNFARYPTGKPFAYSRFLLSPTA